LLDVGAAVDDALVRRIDAPLIFREHRVVELRSLRGRQISLPSREGLAAHNDSEVLVEVQHAIIL
jgi:hypothetical protein